MHCKFNCTSVDFDKTQNDIHTKYNFIISIHTFQKTNRLFNKLGFMLLELSSEDIGSYPSLAIMAPICALLPLQDYSSC